jgi:hypothetical protein
MGKGTLGSCGRRESTQSLRTLCFPIRDIRVIRDPSFPNRVWERGNGVAGTIASPNRVWERGLSRITCPPSHSLPRRSLGVGGSPVTRHPSPVTRHTSHVTRHTSHVTRHMSHVTRHTSHVTRHTSHVTRHTSHVTRHTSHVTCHSLATSGYRPPRSRCRFRRSSRREWR